MSQSSELRSVYLTSFSKTRVVAPAAVRPGGETPICSSGMLVGMFNLQSGQVKRNPPPPQNALCINEFIIRRLNPFVVVDFSFISAPLHT